MCSLGCLVVASEVVAFKKETKSLCKKRQSRLQSWQRKTNWKYVVSAPCPYAFLNSAEKGFVLTSAKLLPSLAHQCKEILVLTRSNSPLFLAPALVIGESEHKKKKIRFFLVTEQHLKVRQGKEIGWKDQKDQICKIFSDVSWCRKHFIKPKILH